MLGLNLLEEYICRSIPTGVEFATNPNLRKKVDDTGCFLPYWGNTVVFLLKNETKQVLAKFQQELYRAAASMLAKPLDADTFHTTLHDLVNGIAPEPERMAFIAQQVRPMLEQWNDFPPLRMKATWMFNMVNTSIVLGLAPTDPGSKQRLEEMYDALEAVLPLGYALTPHITLAYFRPGTYSSEQADALRRALRPAELELELSKPVLQEFSDMNHYRNI